MNDMTSVIIPKSDQINADTLLSGPQTFTIKAVHITGGQEQPVTIELVETNLAYRPCKSMSRVLVQGWGPDSKNYIGKGLTLYRDPTVKWAGMEIGGIRISHMSHIDGPQLMMLTATKGSRKPHKVMPLVVAEQRDKAADWAADLIGQIKGAGDLAILNTIIAKSSKGIAKLEGDRPELHAEITQVEAERRAWLSDDETAFEGGAE